MNPIQRFLKFNLVGAIGVAVQLSALAVFNRLFPGHYLVATAAALELTLLHNFLWHQRYTWGDRPNPAALRSRLLRFHLANGVVSLIGNLVLMRILVQCAHLPILAANGCAIVGCSLVNFTLGNAWAFLDAHANKSQHVSPIKRASSIAKTCVPLFVLALCMPVARAQEPASSSLPEDPGAASATQIPAIERRTGPPPTPVPLSQRFPNASYFLRAGSFCGIGASTSSAATKPTGGCGAGVGSPLVFFEVGVMAPQANRSDLSGYLSLDGSIPLARPAVKYLPFILLGYSRLFETGHALDYGLALALPRAEKGRSGINSYRIELRDYWTFANPTQHNVVLRIGWMIPASD